MGFHSHTPILRTLPVSPLLHYSTTPFLMDPPDQVCAVLLAQDRRGSVGLDVTVGQDGIRPPEILTVLEVAAVDRLELVRGQGTSRDQVSVCHEGRGEPRVGGVLGAVVRIKDVPAV